MQSTLPSSNPKVLFVEDDRQMREHLAHAFSDEFNVETASDGAQALLAVRKMHPDLIVTDIVMPNVDGVQLVRRLRDSPSTATIPILLISGGAPDELRIEGFEVGADSFLAKPYSGRELRARMRSMLENNRRRNDVARHEALQQSANDRAALLESITDGFYAVDAQWRLTYVNQRALATFGSGRDELLGRRLWDVLPQLANSVFEKEFVRAAREQCSVAFEAFTAGTEKWLEVHAHPSANGLAVNFREITERKLAEAALQDSESHFREVANEVPVLMWRSNSEGHEAWFNKTWLKFSGRNLADALRIGWKGIVHPEDLDEALHKYQHCLEHRIQFEIELRMRKHDGAYRWMLNRGNPVFDGPEGTFSGYVGTCIDVTELKLSSAGLLAADERHRAFVANSSEAICRYELDEPLDMDLPIDAQSEHVIKHARVAELNDAMARKCGYGQAAQMVGMPLSATMHPESDLVREHLHRVAQSGFSLLDVESEEKDPDGTTRYFASSLTPVIENGSLVRAWATQRDITDRRRSEENMKKEAVRKDEFLATLAHELRNPLTPIRNGIHILKLRVPLANGGADPVLAMMDRQMTHMVRLVDDLLDLSRISHGRLELRRELVPLADVLDAAVESSAILMEARQQRLVLDFAQRGLIVDGDSTRLVQVFANLLSNSAKFSDPGGQICLSLTREGSDAVISVKDNGIGIPPPMIDQVFEMFSQVRSHQRQAEGAWVSVFPLSALWSSCTAGP